MAFSPGFCTDDDERYGKNIEFGDENSDGLKLSMRLTKDETWEAAFGAQPMSQLNKWGMDCPIHAWCIHMEECNSVCWRIGVSSDEFPSHNLWHWWEKIELGTAPPWAIFLAGGKTDPVIAMPRSILKSGGTKLDINHRKPSRSDIRTRMLHSPVVDGAGRLRLKTGDTVGIVIDCGSKAGDGSVTFFVNGIKAHETCHLYVEPGEKWYPFVCLGSTKIKVRMLSTGESLDKKMWDKPEEQTVSKADIQAARGETQFPGSGWLLSKEASSGKWKRGWYSLQVDSFPWTPYSVLHITLHKGRNLTAMDAGGTSDPFVEFRCGKKPWVDSMGRNAEGFTVVKSKTIDKTLNPVWNEKMQLKLYETEGVLSITCFDKDILGSDVIGHAHIDMSDIRSLSCIGPGGLKRLTNRCFVLKQPGDAGSDHGHLYISMFIGEKEKVEGGDKKGRMVSSSKWMDEGVMMLDDVSRVRPDIDGQADVVFDWNDSSKENGSVTVKLKAEKREEADDWLAEINTFVTTRVITAKAVERIKNFLEGNRPPPVDPKTTKPTSILDPSSFSDLGFSRVAVKWPEHPLKMTDKKLKEGYACSFECQLSDHDIISISPLINESTASWVTELRFDCFSKVGCIGDKGATGLAEALSVNSNIIKVNLAGNSITDRGAHALSKMLVKNRKLEFLKLNGNSIRKPGTVLLLRAITGDASDPPNLVIRELSLDNNIDTGLENGMLCNCRVTGDIT